jgi:hypothetical protein
MYARRKSATTLGHHWWIFPAIRLFLSSISGWPKLALYGLTVEQIRSRNAGLRRISDANPSESASRSCGSIEYGRTRFCESPKPPTPNACWMEVTRCGRLLSAKLKMGSIVPFHGPSSLIACAFFTAPKFLGGEGNISPEALSRNTIPSWLAQSFDKPSGHQWWSSWLGIFHPPPATLLPSPGRRFLCWGTLSSFNVRGNYHRENLKYSTRIADRRFGTLGFRCGPLLLGHRPLDAFHSAKAGFCLCRRRIVLTKPCRPIILSEKRGHAIGFGSMIVCCSVTLGDICFPSLKVFTSTMPRWAFSNALAKVGLLSMVSDRAWIGSGERQLPRRG